MQSSQARSSSTERMRREVERQKQDRNSAANANVQMEDVEETYDEVGEMVRGSGKRQMQIFHYERDINDVVDNSVFDLWAIILTLKTFAQ